MHHWLREMGAPEYMTISGDGDVAYRTSATIKCRPSYSLIVGNVD